MYTILIEIEYLIQFYSFQDKAANYSNLDGHGGHNNSDDYRIDAESWLSRMWHITWIVVIFMGGPYCMKADRKMQLS